MEVMNLIQVYQIGGNEAEMKNILNTKLMGCLVK